MIRYRCLGDSRRRIDDAEIVCQDFVEREISASYVNLTVSANPVVPLHTSAYDGLAVVPFA